MVLYIYIYIYIYIYSWENKVAHTFLKGPKMDVITQLGFELTYTMLQFSTLATTMQDSSLRYLTVKQKSMHFHIYHVLFHYIDFHLLIVPAIV